MLVKSATDHGKVIWVFGGWRGSGGSNSLLTLTLDLQSKGENNTTIWSKEDIVREGNYWKANRDYDW